VQHESEGHGDKAISFVNGRQCLVIDQDSLSANACPGIVLKCRGEFYRPNGGAGEGTVQRCLTP
jgi:hypothetical protein